MKDIEIGTRLIWVDDNNKVTENLGRIYGVVTGIDFNFKETIIIEWENGAISHCLNISISNNLVYLDHPNIKIDDAFYRCRKIESIGI